MLLQKTRNIQQAAQHADIQHLMQSVNLLYNISSNIVRNEKQAYLTIKI